MKKTSTIIKTILNWLLYSRTESQRKKQGLCSCNTPQAGRQNHKPRLSARIHNECTMKALHPFCLQRL
jgi:hypothetical protein